MSIIGYLVYIKGERRRSTTYINEKIEGINYNKPDLMWKFLDTILFSKKKVKFIEKSRYFARVLTDTIEKLVLSGSY